MSAPEKVGSRLWHRVVSRNCTSNLWDLLFFGGCPGIPDDVNAMSGLSWPKLNATVLLELGVYVQYFSNWVCNCHFSMLFNRSIGANKFSWNDI